MTRRLATFAAILGLLSGIGPAHPAEARQGPAPGSEQRSRELDDLEALTRKLERDKKNRPPFEFFRAQFTPFDAQRYVKANHWSTFVLELRSNFVNYEGQLQTSAEVDGRPQVRLLDMPRAMVYRREALLPKEQSLVRSFQVMLPTATKRLVVELSRPGAIRPDGASEEPVQRQEPHQMLVPVLGPDPSAYNAWSSLLATVPSAGDRDKAALDRLRYYRLLLPQDPSRPNLSGHPLTWSTTSHLIWDGFQPETLSRGPLGQQQALLDWLHFGGQLVIVAAGPNVAALQESFLGQYLPATPSGAGASLTEADLRAFAEGYFPPVPPATDEFIPGVGQPRRVEAYRYLAPEPIRPTSDRPLYLTGLEPAEAEGVVAHRLGPDDDRIVAVERRVGRGRVLMLGFNPNDPALTAWPGFDSLVRRLILRRPEDPTGGGSYPFGMLGGPQLSWYRLLSRDLGARPVATDADPNYIAAPGELIPPLDPVAAWTDAGSDLPLMTRETLERASGITIPGSGFVLRVILMYLAALVPVNWLVCRFVLRRRELAWVAVPLLALGFAYGVERAAAFDIGFDSACDEVDLVEIQAGYPRAHVSRFASAYSTGRVRFEIAHPDDPTALALPMKTTQELRGELISLSTFQSSPVPALADFQVEPRSLAMFRAEAMVDLGGGIELVDGKVVNGTDLELLDAVLIDVDSGRTRQLGRIAPWPRTEADRAAGAHEVAPHSAIVPAATAADPEYDWAEREDYLTKLREYRWDGPADAGELRLVAWARGPHPGQRFTPAVDRHRGLRLVVAHLRYGMPDPAGAPYFDPTSRKPEEGDSR